MRGQLHAPAALYPRERPGTHCTGGWVGPRAVWTDAENLASTGIRSPDRPARSQSLYLLSYRAHIVIYAFILVVHLLVIMKIIKMHGTCIEIGNKITVSCRNNSTRGMHTHTKIQQRSVFRLLKA